MITNQLKTLLQTNLSKTVVQAMIISSESKQRKMKHDDYNTSQKYTKLAQAWYHSS